MIDPDLWTYDVDGNPEPTHTAPKTEPDCGACGDGGCPECDPSPEAHAARLAAYQQQRAELVAAVERGEATYDEAPF